MLQRSMENQVDTLGQKHRGKIVGGILGFCLGGPWGAALGVIIGHIHDKQKKLFGAKGWPGLWESYEDFSAHLEQATFTMGVIVLGAKMARSDGRISRAEIEAFKRVFNISPAQEASVGLLFDRARTSADGFEPYAIRLAQVFHNRPLVLEEILNGLFIIGAADSEGLSPSEIAFLRKVSFLFGFSIEDFARIAARSGATMPTSERPSESATGPFVILGVSERATATEIKAAYRSLIRKHHPDKLMAEGVPSEYIAAATEKMKRINVAYAEACKIKGII
jgi:DnaJ like chaperone protein